MFRFSNQPIVSSKFVFGVGNFGVLYDVVPATGENGASVLLNDGGVSGDYVRLRIDSIAPTITSLFVYEDGSFESQGYGDWTYYDSKNGVEDPEINTVTILQASTGSNVAISDTLPSLASAMVMTYSALGSSLTISDVLPSLQSTVSITNVVPEYNLSVADSFGSLQSSMSLVNGVPSYDITIADSLPSLSSSVQMTNVVPTYGLSITDALPSLQSVMGLSFEDATPDITITETFASLQSTITLTNVVPTYTLEITDTFAALQSSVNIINGELTIHVAPQNLIYIKSKSRFITLR